MTTGCRGRDRGQRSVRLYVIVCGSPASRGVGEAVAAGPGRRVGRLRRRHPRRPEVHRRAGAGRAHRPSRCGTSYKYPGDPDVLPAADAMLVAPATVNTINKWAAGIADTLALGLIVEGVGKGLPIVAVPFTNEAMARHPAFPRSIGALREWGVTVLFGEGVLPAFAAGHRRVPCGQVPVAARPRRGERSGAWRSEERATTGSLAAVTVPSATWWPPLDARYPPAWAESWDRVGLVLGEPDAPVGTVLFVVDCVPETVEEAVARRRRS